MARELENVIFAAAVEEKSGAALPVLKRGFGWLTCACAMLMLPSRKKKDANSLFMMLLSEGPTPGHPATVNNRGAFCLRSFALWSRKEHDRASMRSQSDQQRFEESG